MKPKHPKRLYFRKVKRKKPALTWSKVRLHLGNTVAEVSGCILMKAGEAFRGLATSMQRAAAGLGAAVAQLLQQPALRRTYTGTITLQQHELDWLRTLGQ